MGVPLYLRIQQYVREKISSGEWPADQLIPSEAELSRQFGCSRITVTNALRELAKEGLIYRIQGKGTFAGSPGTAIWALRAARPIPVRSFTGGYVPARRA